MRRSLAPVLVVSLLALLAQPGLVSPSAPAAGSATPGSGPASPTGTAPPPATDGATAEIVALYPNPVADGDAGEFVVLSVPPGTDLGGLAVADDEDAVVPNGTAGGRVVLSTAPNATERLTGRSARRLPGALALANGGETVRLRRGNRTLDTASYADADPGEVLDVSTGQWRPLGATDRPVVAAGPGRVRAFVLPDAPDLAVDVLRGADRRVYLAGYTFTSREATEALVAAAKRNATVRVLVDGAPVGGMPAPMARRLDRLAAAGVDVRVLGGPRARYAFHHAKYAVVDDRALVTTENWKPAGTGGHGSRGWAVVTRQPAVVRGLARTFRADAGWRDAVPWREFRENLTTTRGSPATETYPRRFDPRRLRVESARLLVAPDNAERAVVGLVRDATESVRIEQVSIGSRRQPFLRAALAAARRGVTVRILLSGAWYVREENRELAAYLNRVAGREGLDLRARVADPRGRFGKIHAKGVVVDGDQVVVGSLNWNNYSARRNREVALVLEGEEVGAYFRRVFRADWRGGRWTLPAGVGLACLVAVLVAVRRARGIAFAAGEG